MNDQQLSDLQRIARQAMVEYGLDPDFPPAALQQLASIHAADHSPGGRRDQRSLLWCSIDNDDSRDLDQLTVAEELPNGTTKILVAIADVDALVAARTPLDQHAQRNTTSVYTAAKIFPMLPERLSTDLTSLNAAEDRTAVVVEMVITSDGEMAESTVYQALVRNQAKLAYTSVAAWLEGRGPLPPRVAAVPGLDGQLRIQHRVAQSMRKLRHEHGALDLQTIEPRAIIADGKLVGLAQEQHNVAQQLIEDLMIGANAATAHFLEQRGFPSVRRVVRSPKRWDRIKKVAESFHEPLPDQPSAAALEGFLQKRQVADPVRFPDLSLTIVKLLGAGEYAVEMPGEAPLGHFGLAVRDYAHSTAPNRRYPDLITQRLVKAALASRPAPYSNAELSSLAAQCTKQEDAANKVERRVRKSAAALFMSGRTGEVFDALVTGVSDGNTWVRLLQPPVEGKLVQGAAGLDVGDRLKAKLLTTDVQHGFIDFARVP